MSFYNANNARAYSRNNKLIIKEINDIENVIVENVAKGNQQCTVNNTVMTNNNENVEPTEVAKAHCIMEYSLINYSAKEKDYYRVGEVLSIKDDSNEDKIKLKVKEVDDNGNPTDFDIVNRGSYTTLLENTELEYDDKTNYLDINSDFGLESDLMTDRDNKTYVNVAVLNNDETSGETMWKETKTLYSYNNVLSYNFGNNGDLFFYNDSNINIRIDNKWVSKDRIYDYRLFEMPMIYGSTYQVCQNVFGKTYVKNMLGWVISPRYKEYDHLPSSSEGMLYELCYYTDKKPIYKHYYFGKDEIIGWETIEGYAFKCESQIWVKIADKSTWLDWSEKPDNNFGRNGDVFFYNDESYRVKVNGTWMTPSKIYRYDQLYLEDGYGDNYDVLLYNNVIEPYTTYVKLDGKWKKVNKVWNLNEYKLGLGITCTIKYMIKNIIMDNIGSGYTYNTNIVFSSGSSEANIEKLDGRILSATIVKSDEYDIIPTISFVMKDYLESKNYYKVWKQTLENSVYQDEMEQVISHFEDKGYTISRVSNDDEETFHWVVMW